MTVDERLGAAIEDESDPFLSLQVVALIASAGGLHALSTVLRALPAELPAAILIVQHIDPHHRSLLPQILAKQTALQVRHAEGDSVLQRGVVFVAPPDRHLLVNPEGTLSLTRSEPVHFLRPSGDLLLESLATACGARAIGVVLSGTGSDGSRGVSAIKTRGGTVIIQDPETAEYSGMPASAAKTGSVDLQLPLEQIGPVLVELVRGEKTS